MRRATCASYGRHELSNATRTVPVATPVRSMAGVVSAASNSSGSTSPMSSYSSGSATATTPEALEKSTSAGPSSTSRRGPRAPATSDAASSPAPPTSSPSPTRTSTKTASTSTPISTTPRSSVRPSTPPALRARRSASSSTHPGAPRTHRRPASWSRSTVASSQEALRWSSDPASPDFKPDATNGAIPPRRRPPGRCERHANDLRHAPGRQRLVVGGGQHRGLAGEDWRGPLRHPPGGGLRRTEPPPSGTWFSNVQPSGEPRSSPCRRHPTRSSSRTARARWRGPPTPPRTPR